MQKILLTSQSDLKVSALKKFLDTKNIQYELTTVNCDGCQLPPQPFIDEEHDGFYFPKERMNWVSKTHNLNDYDYVVAIESGICYSGNMLGRDFWLDINFVLILHKGTLNKGVDNGYEIPKKYFDKLTVGKLIIYNDKIQGYPVTIGELIHLDDPSINPKNWIGVRPEKIIEALNNCWQNIDKNEQIKKELMSAYVAYDDFPKPGVKFEDVFPLFDDYETSHKLIEFIAQRYKYDEIDYIVGLESRGFILGVPLQQTLKTKFKPIRKAGKLPGKVIKVSYGTEYSKDTCEIQTNIPKGSRVLLIDDLIATGGSMQAGVDLVSQLNCHIVDCCVLREVKGLRSKCRETMKQSYTVLLQE